MSIRNSSCVTEPAPYGVVIGAPGTRELREIQFGGFFALFSRRIVRYDRPRTSEAVGRHAIRLDAFSHQILLDPCRAPLAQIEVE